MSARRALQDQVRRMPSSTESAPCHLGLRSRPSKAVNTRHTIAETSRVLERCVVGRKTDRSRMIMPAYSVLAFHEAHEVLCTSAAST